MSASLRLRVRAQAQYRCGYCLRTEELTGECMTLEHIRPEGRVVARRLWVAAGWWPPEE